jgi:PAS domain-containing protein
MSHPALWLYLLGAVTVLLIVLRRVLHRQAPLSDELYSKQVAVDHVHSGVAWVRSDGMVGSVNPALAHTLAAFPREILGYPWELLFTEEERPRVLEAYRQALLMGTISLSTVGARTDGGFARVDVTLVTVHDSRTRFVGHYCLMQDRTREIELEEQVEKLTAALEAGEPAARSKPA